MKPYQERVITEKSDLDIKIEKLKSFLDGDIYISLPVDERKRLFLQHFHMSEYSKVLGERIAAFLISE